MALGVHRQVNRRVSHAGLDDLRGNPRERHKRPGRVPERMDVEDESLALRVDAADGLPGRKPDWLANYAERSGHMAIATAGRPHLRLEHAVSVLEVPPAGRAARILQHGGSSRGGDKVIRTELETEVLALPEEDRVRLVELLWESLTPRDVQARAEKWSAESERRLDAVQAGRLPSIDAAKVF